MTLDQITPYIFKAYIMSVQIPNKHNANHCIKTSKDIIKLLINY